MRMKKYYYLLFTANFLLLSCGESKQGDLLEIPVDIVNNTVLQLPLSEIAESITAIELELTDESIINPKYIKRIIFSDDMIFIAQKENILVFNGSGKFIRSIGSKGQGPGEYLEIRNIVFDETNKRLFLVSWRKIICYDLSGNVLMESSFSPSRFEYIIYDINYFNNELLLIGWSIDNKDETGLFAHAEVFRLNEDLQIIDSSTILKVYEHSGWSDSGSEDYILLLDSTVYLYYPFSTAHTSNALGKVKQEKSVLRDTLYRFENNQLIPDLKLKFNRNGIDIEGYMFIKLINIYRSSRYIFAEYYNYAEGRNDNNIYSLYVFCYDTKTGKGYRVVRNNRYTDDINQIEHVLIRPLNSNTEMFYYTHTHMNPNDLEEPNPTLYIGKLKK